MPERTFMCLVCRQGLVCNLDLDDRIYECLLTSMADVDAADLRTVLMFMGDLKGRYREWLGSITANHHVRVAALDFATASGCDPRIQQYPPNSCTWRDS